METEIASASHGIDKVVIDLDEKEKTTVAKFENDPLVELRPSLFVRKSQITDLDVRNILVKCTACGQQINHHDASKIKKHSHLGVITCKECYSFYNSGEFTKGEDGYYNYCIWCGNGGKLFICDSCPYVICNPCIRRNFGRSEVAETEKEGWRCYCCEPIKLKPKVEFCDLLLDYVHRKLENKEKKAQNVIAANRVLSQKWIKEILDETDLLSRTFQKKVIKLKDIDKSGSKSVKHIVKKVEQVISDHKHELKYIVRALSKQYKEYVASNLNAEEMSENNDIKTQKDGDKLDVHDVMSDTKENSNSNCNLTSSYPDVNENSNSNCNLTSSFPDVKDEVFGKMKKDSVYGENSRNSDSKCNENKENVIDSESLIENVANDKCNERKENKLHDQDSESLTENMAVDASSDLKNHDNALEKCRTENDVNKISAAEDKDIILAKISLLDELENSESPEQSACEMESETKKGGEGNLVDEIVDKDFTTHSANENSIDAFQTESTVRRKLDFSNGSESSSSVSVSSTKKPKRFKKKDRKTENESISKGSNKTTVCGGKKEDKQKTSVSMDDPKLKLPVNIVLNDCMHMLQNGQCTVKISDVDDIDKLEKIVDNLHKFSEKRSKPKTANNENKVKSKNSSNLKKGKKVISDSSSSICFSSLSEEEKIEEKKKFAAAKNVDSNCLAKNDLMNSESSSEDSSSEPDVVVKRSKKNGSKSKVESDGSENDFQPNRKKKYDKLLHKRLLSDDGSDSKEKNPSEIGKKKHSKRKKTSQSDEKGSTDTTTSDSDVSSKRKKEKSKPKKRRRIQNLDSSSDEKVKNDNDDDMNSQGAPSNKGRKNIKKIISQKKLAVETKEAQELEKERKRRIQERQKLYNKIQDVSEDGKEVITRKFVLEVDQSSKEEVVEIDPDLVQKLKPHQVNGVKFLWECTIESLKDLDKPGSGGILAHCMGLGKSLQVVAYLHTCLTNKYVKEKIKTAVIICPFNTALNWQNEFDIWLSDVDNEIKVHQLATAKTNFLRLDIISYWQKEGGVLIVSYDLFRRLAATKVSGLRKDKKEKLRKLLIDPGPDIVVCDEGHILKNESSAISKAVSQLRTSRRIVLTGTPLQNNLKEYHCMLNFVKPNLLGTAKEFRNRFVNPIINGQYGDSKERDVKLMKKRIHILHKLLDGCVQRCDYSALAKFLPPKHEFVISVKMSDVQIKMYQCYLDKLSNAKNESTISGTTLFTDFNALRCIWTHPYLCEVSFKRAEIRRIMHDDDEEIDDFINDNTSESDEKSTSESASNKEKSDSGDEVIKSYKTRSRSANADCEDDDVVELDGREEEKQWYHDFISEEDKHKIELSGKISLLIDILKECESIGDKILVFSQSLLTLDLIEDILGYLHDQPSPATSENATTSELPNQYGSWLKGRDYFRMDGKTNAESRKSFIDMFNNLNYDRARLFLISTRAGSLGTNLVGANRVIIMDTSWNPSHDVQAIFRVFRFGQVKPVYIYRFLAQGTMEEKIYERQVTKLSLSIRVIDEQQIDRHFSASDLAALYTFTPDTTTDRPTPMIPKDRMLAEMLIKNKEWIVTYHEHDSLLQNETEEDLTEEERKMAWTEYENEREGQPLNSELTNDDIKIYYQEPDFSQATYQGNLIPDLQTIVGNIAAKLAKKHVPNSMGFFKQLLVCLQTVRTVFLEKQVKILRMKQEFFKHGSVPESINKYLGEVNNSLISLNNYMTRVSQAIFKGENAAKVAQNVDQQRTQNSNIKPQNANSNQPQMRMQPPNQFPQQMGNQAFRPQPNIRSFTAANINAFTAGNARFFLPRNTSAFAGNARYTYVSPAFNPAGQAQYTRTASKATQEKAAPRLNSQIQKDKEPIPVITEVDEIIIPDEVETTVKRTEQSGTSSVVIEEVE